MVNRQDVADTTAKRLAILKGDEQRVANQLKAGKLLARERAEKLLDQGSFVELDTLVSAGAEGAGVVTGYGTVSERPVYLFSQDFTVHGGAMGEMQAKKILKVLELARKTGTPVVAMLDSAGIRLDEGAQGLNAYASVYAQMARMSGVCPMLALVLGPCVGAAAMMTQICDIAIMAGDVGALLIQGPQVLSAAFQKEYTLKSAGGADVMKKQGAVALVADNEEEAFTLAATLLDLLPGCNMEDAPIIDTDDMNRLLPETDWDDCFALLTQLMDNGTFVELYNDYGKALVVALGRMGGRTVGVVASNPKENEGRLTACASRKAARFVRMCDCYHLPVVSLINTAGVALVDVDKQQNLISASAQLLYAYAEATCTKLAVVTGNAIGQAFVAMGGKANADVTYAWPGAVISALSPDAAVAILNKKEINESTGNATEARRALSDAYKANVAGAINAAQSGMVDDVIDPSVTRQMLIASLEMLSSKRDATFPKKHGNLPL